MHQPALAHQILERQGCPLHYWLAGPADQPLVVFTHGATMDHHMYDAQVSIMAARYRVLTWDVRGHGQSQPLGPAFSTQICVDDLSAILDHIEAPQVTLVGQSMGGYIAQEFVFRYSSRVTALVMIGGTCITLRHSRFMQGGVQALPLIARLTPYAYGLQQTGKSIRGTPETAAYAMQAARQISKQTQVRIWAGLRTVLHYEPTYHIDQPLLLTHGDRDTLGWPATIMPKWASRDPHSQYVVVPNAGHNANQDNPRFFNELLLTFLQQHVPTRPAHKEQLS